MSTPKGYSTQEKDDRLKSEFVTIQPIGPKKFGLDVSVSMYHQLVNDGDLIDAVPLEENGDVVSLTINGHGANKGDIVYFKTGNQANRQIKIWDVPDVNTIVLAETIVSSEPLPAIGDEIDILAPIMPRTNAEGDIYVTSGGTKFIKDGSEVLVTEDTVTPANNLPLPVKLTGLDGDVVINSPNLNLAVQLDHDSANPDSVQIGDGTEIVQINASGEMQTSDDAARTSLGNLLTELQAKADLTETQPVSAATLPLPTGAATETTLGNLLTELQAKADLSETQPVSAASLPLPTGAATETTLGNLLTELQAKADLSETQPVSATNLDIRDLSSSQDAVEIQTAAGQALAIDGSGFITSTINGTVTVSSTNLDIRDLASSQDSVEIQTAAGQALAIDGSGFITSNINGTVVVSSTNLDIRDLTHTSDSIKIGDGVETANINASNELLVRDGDANTKLGNIEDATALLDTVETGSEVIDLNGVTDGSWVQLIPNTTADIKKAAIFMSSGKLVEFGVGAAASEVRKFVVPPGGLPGQQLEVNIASGSRIAYKMVSGEAAGVSGEKLVINWMG